MVKKYVVAIVMLTSLFGYSQETFKAMFYNVLNFPLQEPVSRIQYLDVILNDYLPDVFMICELNNEDGADDILRLMQDINPNYQRALFVENTSDDTIGDQNDLQNMIFYDSSKFILESQAEVTTIYRDFNHYKLKLNTIDQASKPVYLDVFVTHLKSSSGTDNKNLRKQMVDAFVAYLSTMPNDSNVLLAGDLNLYTSSEPAFQELIDQTNNITLMDPANRIGSWSNNTSYLDVFTQSTRTTSALGGAGGGFDDRFDFIMTSENMATNPDISFVSGTYQAYGNNNNSSCYNENINSVNCSGPTFSQSIRDALYYFSDHLPVTLTLETNETLSNKTLEPEYGITIEGSNLIRDNITVKIHPQLNITTLRIYNVLGQKMEEYKVVDRNFINLNVSYLSSGMYYIITDKNITEPLKFIKH
ncbi:T9SS type A sorting domain-containing protein [Pontimicrobium aquaticum]|uniref:T9SS type A sorting domain-containing protein n=1 Tax=Pontimicrobium aquaticum TaxID=2565367 RepID=A0A4U0EVU3_9FLAO|nr:T9SS type A sorting domain-containing protein [Pontimicrobium aquaticum]TJY36005.1 T9SS type A sorting domain-containing protein [Pontimicrobium aquaticum]